MTSEQCLEIPREGRGQEVIRLIVKESYDAREIVEKTFIFSSYADAAEAQEMLEWVTRGADPDPLILSEIVFA